MTKAASEDASLPLGPAVDEQLARSEWRMTFMAAWLVVVGTAAFFWIDAGLRGVRSVEGWVRVLHTAASAVVLVALWLRRRRPTRRLCMISMALLVLPFVPSFWFSEATGAQLDEQFVPFVGHKLVLFGVAALTPGPVWFGALLLGALVVQGIAVWFVLDLGSAAFVGPTDEPWASVVYALFSFVLYAYRLSGARRDRELARARAEAASLQRMTRAFLAVRDLANTPLQNLEFATALLRRSPEQHERATAVIQRALERMRELRHLLEPQGTIEASLDVAELHRTSARMARAEGARAAKRNGSKSIEAASKAAD